MNIVIAARFSGQDEVAQGVNDLVNAGLSPDLITTFYFNPAGQHDLLPHGGDCDASPSAREAGAGAVKGATDGGIAGAVICAAAIPFVGPVGALLGTSVGAYVGSLVGGIAALKDREDTSVLNDYVANERKSGMFIGVQIQNAGQEALVISIFRACRATDFERGAGRIVKQDWVDFDPLSTPSALEINKSSPLAGDI
ncbi:MAG: hypothetical protein EOO81_03220 [Oxalobacteraceae bacterium]|nr:MAG: hypothetical protein EOO81_03220 [Oxalobacteraceae bacterium]